MKKLNQLNTVKKALVKIAQGKTTQYNNGTYGEKVKCYHWNTEETTTDEARELERVILAKKFANQDYSQEMSKLQAIPKKAMMIFRLVEPMNIRGTKVAMIGEKSVSPEIKNCREIYIPEDLVNATHTELSYEETNEKEIDIMGNKVPVLLLDLGRCMIDITEGKRDFKDSRKWLRAPRAYVTDIPYRSMQIVGGLLSREEYSKNRAMNYVSDDSLFVND